MPPKKTRRGNALRPRRSISNTISYPSHAPMDHPNKQKGGLETASRASASAFLVGRRGSMASTTALARSCRLSYSKGCLRRELRPGYSTGSTSTCGGRRFCHPWYDQAPQPAWGRQKRRSRTEGSSRARGSAAGSRNIHGVSNAESMSSDVEDDGEARNAMCARRAPRRLAEAAARVRSPRGSRSRETRIETLRLGRFLTK